MTVASDAVVEIDLRDESVTLDPRFEWVDTTPLGAPPWARRYARGMLLDGGAA
jgi:hypothetical protein